MHPSPTQAEIQKSLKASLWDGAFWSLTVGFSEIYFSPFALFLGATNIFIGLLSSIPPLIGSLAQLFTLSLVKRVGSRKRLVLAGTVGQGLLVCFLGFVAQTGEARLILLFLILSLYWIAWMIQVPAWQSWMGDLVPAERRGEYFAERNRIIQVVTFLALIAAGALLNHFQKFPSQLFWGFFSLFMIGMLGRVLSFFFIRRQTDLPTLPENERPLSFIQFIRKMPGHSFGVFVLYTTLFSAAVNLSAPYFIPYFLEDLKFSYLQFMGLMAAMVASKYFFLPLWGRRADRHGSRKIFIAAGLIFSINPLFMLVSSNYYYLLGVQLILGIGVAGFELCSLNFLLDHTRPEERTRLAAYYETLVGLGIVMGALAGGWLLTLFPLSGKAYFVLFLTSGMARLILSLAFLPRLRTST